MARLGITYHDVENAANQLLGQGKQPTIELIRHLLGTGSSTTIANHLRQWRQVQDGTVSLSKAENLPKEMITLMKGLWEQLCAQAENKIVMSENKYQAEIAELQQALQKYQTNNQRWQQLFNQWQQEKAQLDNDKLTLETAVDSLKKEHIALQSKHDVSIQQLQEKQERIAELHRLHAQAQTNLEHYRESSREQRLIEQQQFEQQKQTWHAENKTLKDQVSVLKEKAFSMQQQHQGLQQSHAALEKNYTHVEAKLVNQQQQLLDIEKAKNEHLQAREHWQQQYREAQKILESKNAQLIDIQTDTNVLSQQLVDSKQSLKDALDQHKLIAHEKWMLMQEKAQLEGQLKQLQEMVSV